MVNPDFEVTIPKSENEDLPEADIINVMPFELDYTGPTDSVQKFLPSDSNYDILFRGKHIEAHKIAVPDELKMVVCNKEDDKTYTVESVSKEFIVWENRGENEYKNAMESALNTYRLMRDCAVADD
ncbi:unnamed protein product [Bursaphelenchus xylophilus]|uniref:(pine wood nematode) hypothetical protein n=1 Tax=Bursaphelenchus xylophilus TaxID=6326 RepID=A0A1I7S965_BURXY|nr:unnamed protein product [Bursaphelenchus xylophilus]CAG9086339.1 unnamed protein product [Bursaphelenchus xylophilus]